MTTGWLQLDITYDEATSGDYEWIFPSISEDEDKVSVYIYLIDRTVEYELKRKEGYDIQTIDTTVA